MYAWYGIGEGNLFLELLLFFSFPFCNERRNEIWIENWTILKCILLSVRLLIIVICKIMATQWKYIRNITRNIR